MLIEIPDARTSEDNWYDCGLVCTRAVLAFFGKPLDYANRLTPSPTIGTPVRSIIQTLQLSGLLVASGNMSVDILKRASTPIICCVNDTLDHYVVVRGVARNRVYYFDPASGYTSSPVPKFLANWHSIGSSLLSQFGIMVTQ
jgi:ATP-binding cassette, subfamily B, bacterial CvaB/MchF/RaxB